MIAEWQGGLIICFLINPLDGCPPSTDQPSDQNPKEEDRRRKLP